MTKIRRRPVRRDNGRHQWEKDRARLAESERRAAGATERDTGLDTPDLDFRAAYRRLPAPPQIARLLDVPSGTPLVERSYATRHRSEDVPFDLSRSYLVAAYVDANPELLDEANEPWPGGTQSQLHTVGIEVDRIVEQVTARPPTAEEAEALGLPAGAPVMVLHKVCIDTGDRPVEAAEVILPGDRTALEFTTPLVRWGA